MKYGIREICDVVLKAKSNQKVGNKIFYKNEPVIYFDTLKTSSLEGAATTVYAQGGRGNARLVAWEGERTVTFTMEDALISPIGFSILTGAGLIEANNTEPLYVHTTEVTEVLDGGIVKVTEPAYTPNAGTEDWIYMMVLDNGEPVSEPYIGKLTSAATVVEDGNNQAIGLKGNYIELKDSTNGINYAIPNATNAAIPADWQFTKGKIVLVDYYSMHESGVQQINITPDKFGGNYYLEASTLFRDQAGVDHAAEFVIPNCKIQSNFTFTMASSGDPSTFTFTMDAFPDYTRFDKTKKVLAAIQIIGADNINSAARNETWSKDKVDIYGRVEDYVEAGQ